MNLKCQNPSLRDLKNWLLEVAIYLGLPGLSSLLPLPQKLALAHRPFLLHLLSSFTMITLTANAVQELKALLVQKGASEESGLRLGVQRGGCAGLQYTMQVAAQTEGDEVIEQDGVRVFLSADSLEHLRGCNIDYSNDLSDAGFKACGPRLRRDRGVDRGRERGQAGWRLGQPCGRLCLGSGSAQLGAARLGS